MLKQFAPGRVNLIGEHLDYNGGWVMPAALSLGITAEVEMRNDGKIHFSSATHDFKNEIDVSNSYNFDQAHSWTNYPIGVIEHLKRERIPVQGCNIHYHSTLPEGSGLSSSAAIEILTASIMLRLTNAQFDKVWLANFCKQVENEFIGVQCGIMDQYAVALGLKNHALLLDCRQLKHEYIPFETDTYKLVIMDTCKPRSLIHSKYNERRTECETALQIINATYSEHPFASLAEVPMHVLNLLNDEVLSKRAKHVVSEQLRVKESAKVLQHGDLTTFGRLMNASHDSLKNHYEVSGEELDALVSAASLQNGCLGARMTGAGFGGCAIALVHHTALQVFEQNVAEMYYAQTGLNARFYPAEISDGVHTITT